MNFLVALYGSQYYDIEQKGKDGNNGRLNANIFLSALIILAIIAAMMICVRFVPGFNDSITRAIRNIFGHTGGKAIGKLLAIILVVIIYVMISKTIGSERNFKNKVETFMKLPNEIKKKANTKLLVPFFILLGIVFGLAIW